MKFAEVIDGLGQGLAFSRKKWEFLRIGNDVIRRGRFIVRQIPQAIPAGIVPKMTSLPDSAKELLMCIGDGAIRYRDQVLIVECDGHGENVATSYSPSWEDIFAEDWEEVLL